MKPQIKLVTIGVYGFDEAGFFSALLKAGVDTFVDIRYRRGMRGSKYAFANSAALRRKLNALGIRYLHVKDLGAPPELRQVQNLADQAEGVLKRERATLSPAFIRAYEEKVLSRFDPEVFLNQLPPESATLALFCVEGAPAACHRSLVAGYLSKHYGFQVEDIVPWKS